MQFIDVVECGAALSRFRHDAQAPPSLRGSRIGPGLRKQSVKYREWSIEYEGHALRKPLAAGRGGRLKGECRERQRTSGYGASINSRY